MAGRALLQTIALSRRLLIPLALLLAVPASADAAQHRPLPIEVVSNRADLVSAGDVLVAIKPRPRGVNHERIRVALNDEDVTDAFAMRPNDRFEGLVTGLELGRNALTARVKPPQRGEVVAPVSRRRGKAIVTNHPNGGPVFSGPQVGPWTCQATAVDDQCNQDPVYEYQYKSTDGQLKAYDPASPPSDVASTTTDEGVTVPFIIRTETGYQDRDQYKIATLFQPGEDWEPWAPQEQWNHKLLVTHGASCGVTYKSGEAPSVTADGQGGILPDQLAASSPTEALGRGFAVMSTALNNAGHNCNIATQAESLVMAKERIVEQYGEIRYTIGTGCSGGSLTQQQVANAYPGVYQGILPQCSYPDALSTGAQFADYHLLRLYFEDIEARLPQLWTPAQWGPVEGHLLPVNAIAADEAFFKSATSPGGDCVAPDVVYDAETNPGGVRCSILDYMINIFGPRKEADWSPMEQAAGRGFGAFPVGNVGVQYGLGALESALITTEQFVDLNAEIGGLDIDINQVPERIAGDPEALANTYRSGAINQANNLDQVAIIDLRGPDPGIAHDAYRSWETRARLDREHGDHDNQVIWFGATPVLGDVNFPTEALIEMDEWLTAVEEDSERCIAGRQDRREQAE